MNTLLIHIPQITDGKREIMVMPMGLFSIADYLNKNDIYSRILHLGIQKEAEKNFDIIKFIKNNNFKVVCFDIHWIKQAKQTIEYIRLIKHSIPDIITVAGGISATYFADEMLKHIPEVDFIIRGEGEYPLLTLIKRLNNLNHKSFADIPNLSYRHNNKIHHNKISFFTDAVFYRDISHSNFKLLYKYERYFSQMLYADFDTTKPLGIRDSYKNTFFYNPGKGCPYNCIYCGSYFYKKRYIRQKKGYYFFNIPKATTDIINAAKYGADTLRISFDPEPGRKYYKKLFPLLPKKRLRLIFDCFSLPDESFARTVERSFRSDSVLVISVETGNDLVRRKIQRPFFTNNDLMQCLKILSKFKFNTHIFISFGLPYETEESYSDTVRLIQNIKEYKNIGITVCPIILDIGSRIYEYSFRYKTGLAKRSLSDWINEEVSDNRSYFSTSYLSEDRTGRIIRWLQKEI